MSELEKKLENTIVSLTDQCTYFPCIVGRPRTEYPEYLQCFPPVWNYRTLYVSCRGRSYKKIAENIYEGVMDEKRDLFSLSRKDRRLLYELCCEKNYTRQQDTRHWSEK